MLTLLPEHTYFLAFMDTNGRFSFSIQKLNHSVLCNMYVDILRKDVMLPPIDLGSCYYRDLERNDSGITGNNKCSH